MSTSPFPPPPDPPLMPPPPIGVPAQMASVGATPTRPYRSPAGLATVLRWCLLGGAMTTAVDAGANAAADRVLGRVATDAPSVDPGVVAAVDLWTAGAALVQALFLVTAFGLLVAWTSRSYRNLSSFGVRDLRFREGWAIGAWFVPFLNFVRPKAILNDIWRGSGPPAYAGDHWKGRSVPAVLHWWWAARLLSWFFLHPTSRDASGPAELQSMATTAIVGDAVVLVAIVLEIVVVTRLTDRQDGRYGVRSTRRRLPWRLIAVTSPLVAIACCGTTFAAASSGLDRSVDDARRPVLAVSLAVGQCFDLPSGARTEPDTSTLLGVELVPCDEPHDSEVVAAFDHEAERDAPYPGDDELIAQAGARCVEPFEEFVGTTFEASALDIYVVGPSSEMWSEGDRGIRCAAARVDGLPLDGSVRASGI